MQASPRARLSKYRLLVVDRGDRLAFVRGADGDLDQVLGGGIDLQTESVLNAWLSTAAALWRTLPDFHSVRALNLV
jgi:hypothetical protein